MSQRRTTEFVRIAVAIERGINTYGLCLFRLISIGNMYRRFARSRAREYAEGEGDRRGEGEKSPRGLTDAPRTDEAGEREGEKNGTAVGRTR